MVVAAAGNSGTDGLWTYGAPASEDDAVAIASTENKYSLGAAITLDKAIKVGGKTTRVVGEHSGRNRRVSQFETAKGCASSTATYACEYQASRYGVRVAHVRWQAFVCHTHQVAQAGPQQLPCLLQV